MINGIIPIWVTYYAKDIVKLDKANVLNSYDEKYHVYDHEYGAYLQDDQERKTYQRLRTARHPDDLLAMWAANLAR